MKEWKTDITEQDINNNPNLIDDEKIDFIYSNAIESVRELKQREDNLVNKTIFAIGALISLFLLIVGFESGNIAVFSKKNTIDSWIITYWIAYFIFHIVFWHFAVASYAFNLQHAPKFIYKKITNKKHKAN